MRFSFEHYRRLLLRAPLQVALVPLLALLPLPAGAAEADSFKTQEYWNSTGLDFIRAADAYALGYTGAGITLGVIDQPVRADHPELAGKMGDIYLGINPNNGLRYNPNWIYDTHGSHVAGIMAAWRDGIGMHGVAFDARLVTAANLGNNDAGQSVGLGLPDLVDFYAARPDIRVINNSWGTSIFPALDPAINDQPDEVENRLTQDLVDVGELSTIHDKVIVFSAGNDGSIAADLEGSLPRYFPELKGWLSVISLDTGNITTAADGTRTISPGGVSGFSNLAYKAQLWSISAPGSNINSLEATDNGYSLKSGTSMAAPYVSGALGLVQQAFPWMSGKQLADAVLTTADNSFVAPPYLIRYTAGNGSLQNVTLVIIDNAVAPPDVATLQRWIDDAYASEPRARDALKNWVAQNGWDVEDLNKEEVFGQGLLDVGKAVRGIARLDANRLIATDVVSLAELGKTQALETFNTKGYFAEFSNDITQRMWNDDYHHPDFLAGKDATALRGRDIGLIKTGDGLLVLSGTNDYRGATLVEGGSLAVSRRADGSGGVLTYSDVVVRQGGTLLGDGDIRQQLFNSGLVIPGYRGSVLTVGDYTQTAGGALGIAITAEGRHTALRAASATLGGALNFAPAYGFYADSYRIDVDSVQTNAASGRFDTIGITHASPTLSFSVLADNGVGHVTIGQQRAPGAYSRYANNATAANVGNALGHVAGYATGDMQNLLQVLDWSHGSGRDIASATEQLGPGGYDAVARAGMEARRQLNLLLVRRFLNGNTLTAAAGSSVGMTRSDWQVWAMPFGGYNRMGTSAGAAGFTSSDAGVALGAERKWDNGLVLGLDAALSNRRTSVRYAGQAKADTTAASVGAYALFKPESWNGAYLMGMTRLGFEEIDMKRKVSFSDYRRQHDSRWTDVTVDVLAGGGKDWSWTGASGKINAGPLAWMEYGLNARPGFSENGFGASALTVRSSRYQSVSSVLGAHVNLVQALDSGTTLSWDLLAGWRHVWRDGSFDTTAGFKGYGATFKSRSDVPERDGMLAQASLRAVNANGYFAQVELRTELFRSQAVSFAGGVSFGLQF